MEAHEGIRVNPMTSRKVTPIHHDHICVAVGDELVHESHGSGARSNDEVVGLNQNSHYGLRFDHCGF